MPKALDDTQIEAALQDLDHWGTPDGALHRQFVFENFVEAFGFMAKVAILAEKAFHHPDWSNSWNRVDISITNHEAGGISQQCVDLAKAIDELHA